MPAPFSFLVPASSSSTRQVIFGGQTAVYRFFNSSDRVNPAQKKINLINGRASGAATEVPQDLLPTMSLDVAIGPSDDATVQPVGILAKATNGATSEENISGSFELIRDAAGRIAERGRRGRFNFPPRVPASFLPVLLADLGNSASLATYRFVNTGENEFQVFVAADKTSTGGNAFSVVLTERQSVDFDVTSTNKRRIFVTRTTNSTGKLIRGVFELLR